MFFFFQAEDGIRDIGVTGVQTCALPISVRATPLHGQVVFMPSTRNWFSLVPEPNTEMVVAILLDGEEGDTPGAALTKSHVPRRVGIASTSSEPKRVANPGLRASMRETVPSITSNSSTP